MGDNEFNNRQWKEGGVSKLLESNKWFTPPHSPTTGRGGLERMHRELNRLLANDFIEKGGWYDPAIQVAQSLLRFLITLRLRGDLQLHLKRGLECRQSFRRMGGLDCNAQRTCLSRIGLGLPHPAAIKEID